MSMVAQNVRCFTKHEREKFLIHAKPEVLNQWPKTHNGVSTDEIIAFKRIVLKIKGVKIGEVDYKHTVAVFPSPSTVLKPSKKAVCKTSTNHPKIEKLNQEDQSIQPGLEVNSSTWKEMEELVALAKRTADAVAKQRLSTTSPEFSECLNALNKLKTSFPLSLSTDALNSTNSQVSRCLQYLTQHPKVKIRTEANNVLDAWKKSSWELPQIKKFRGHVQEALSKVRTEVSDESVRRIVEASDPAQIAASIESLIYRKMGESNGKSDKAKYRSILFNLRDPNNPDLRRQVLLGEIKPEKLINMTGEEMASSKRKRENDEIRGRHLMKGGICREDEETTDQFRCGKCGERKCTYNQLQTRSADEPMTTYVRCVLCSNRWKF